jgi:Zn-dependent protease/CBS domain-containing protein
MKLDLGETPAATCGTCSAREVLSLYSRDEDAHAGSGPHEPPSEEEIMRGFRIGRLFGIDLRVDPSWLIIFVLLTWNLVSVFSRWHPDWSSAEVLVIALSASVVFFCCVLLHELAHSLVAMGFGVRVRSITLFLFGGVSNIEHEPPSAKAEFFIAIVGPITSVGLGILFLVLASVFTSMTMTDPEGALSAFSHFGPLTTLLAWLGPINILIGVFNLIPGFPLDGGRVLRSILWSITGNLRTATRWASASGQTIGWLFIACGIAMSFGVVLPFFGTGLVGGIWLAFIGWFLRGAATQASMRLALEDALAGMTVEQLMQRHGPVGTPDLAVTTLVHEHLIPGDDRALAIVDDGTLIGLVSIADVRRVPPEQWASTPVHAIMRGGDMLTVATPGEPLAEAFEKIALQDIEQLPVVSSGKLVGMLRRRDITRWLELAWRPEATAATAMPPRAAPAGHAQPPADVYQAT